MILYKDRNCACAPDRPATFIRSDESDIESVRYKETECKQPDECTQKTFVGFCSEKENENDEERTLLPGITIETEAIGRKAWLTLEC